MTKQSQSQSSSSSYIPNDYEVITDFIYKKEDAGQPIYYTLNECNKQGFNMDLVKSVYNSYGVVFEINNQLIKGHLLTLDPSDFYEYEKPIEIKKKKSNYVFKIDSSLMIEEQEETDEEKLKRYKKKIKKEGVHWSVRKELIFDISLLENKIEKKKNKIRKTFLKKLLEESKISDYNGLLCYDIWTNILKNLNRDNIQTIFKIMQLCKSLYFPANERLNDIDDDF